MSHPKIPPTIKPAGYGKSLLGYAIDFACTVALMLILYFTIGQRVMLPSAHWNERRLEYASLVARSQLADAEGEKIIDLSYKAVGSAEEGYEYGYAEYSKRIFHYFYVEVGQTEGETPFTFLSTDGFTPTVEDKTSQEYKVEVGKWIYSKVYDITGEDKGLGDSYFKTPANDAEYLAVPVLKDAYKAKLDDASSRQEAAEKILYYFRSPSSSATLYAASTAHFTAQESVSRVQAQLNTAEYLSLVPSFVIAPLVFYFLIPIFSKNGRTLGKRAAGTAVIGDDGYKAKKINIILHYGIILLEYELMLIPIIVLGITAWMFVSLIGFMVLVMSKNHQSVHDKIASTIVIKYKESLWFESEEAERAYAENNPSSTIAKILRERAGETSETQGGRRLVVTQEQFEAEESILDLSTINRRRAEARNMTSFDAFEQSGPIIEGENNHPESEEEVELTEQEKADLLALEGELPEEETPKNPYLEQTGESIEGDDDFVDTK